MTAAIAPRQSALVWRTNSRHAYANNRQSACRASLESRPSAALAAALGDGAAARSGSRVCQRRDNHPVAVLKVARHNLRICAVGFARSDHDALRLVVRVQDPDGFL